MIGAPLRKEQASRFLETGDDFQTEYDWKELSEYLIPVANIAVSHDVALVEKLQHHYEKCKKMIAVALPKIQEQMEHIVVERETDIAKDFILPLVNEANREVLIKINFLMDKMRRVHAKSITERVKAIVKQKRLLQAMSDLLDYLLANPKPVMIKITRAVAKVDDTLFALKRPYAHKLRLIRRQAGAELDRVRLYPPPFRSENCNKRFFKDAIESGVNAKKPGTSYFWELPVEESLRVFLKGDTSPLFTKKESAEPLWPYHGETDRDSVKEWIIDATELLCRWLGEEEDERCQAVAIIVTRFLFYATHPLLYHAIPLDIELAKKMEAFAQRAPNDIGIAAKYIPPQCRDKPVAEMFEIDSIARAPVEWFRSAVHQVCPTDAAYCIVKVHESLSVMAVLRDTARKTGAEMGDFCEKMPGFDDIFEIWLSLLATVGFMNPESVMTFIEEYSKLPGFTARIMVSVTYLEASLTQFKQGEEDLP